MKLFSFRIFSIHSLSSEVSNAKYTNIFCPFTKSSSGTLGSVTQNMSSPQLPSKHCATTSPTILNFYLNTFSIQIPMKCGRRNMISVELFSGMCKVLENFISLKHPQICVKHIYFNVMFYVHITFILLSNRSTKEPIPIDLVKQAVMVD